MFLTMSSKKYRLSLVFNGRAKYFDDDEESTKTSEEKSTKTSEEVLPRYFSQFKHVWNIQVKKINGYHWKVFTE